jgi:hypothetical protein
MQVSPQFDVPGLGSERLALQAEQNEPGSRAIRNADRHWLTVVSLPHARLNDQCDALTVDLPSFVVSEPSVGQGGLTPARVEEAYAGVLVGHIGRCRLYDRAVELVEG